MRFLLSLIVVAGTFATWSCKDSKDKEATALSQTPTSEDSVAINVPAAEPSELAASATLSAEQAALASQLENFISDEYVEAFIKRPASKHWYGFYMAGRKAGYAVLEMRRSEAEEVGAFMVAITIFMKADGQDMRMRMATFYAGAPSYETLAIHTEESSASATMQRRFVREGERTQVLTRVDGKESAPSFAPAMCGTLRTELASFAPDLRRVTAGTNGRYCSFSSDEQKQELSELRVVSVEERQVSGVPLKVATVEQRSAENKPWTSAVVTEDGTSLEVKISEGLVIKLEDQELAQSSVEGIDIFAAAVKANKALGDPMLIKELKLQVTFAEGFTPPPSTPNQRVEKQGDNQYKITIRSVPGAKVLPAERAEALVSVGDIDASNPAIIAHARTITAGAKTDKDKIAAVNGWVYRNLAKSLSTNLTTASQVLDHKTGDCTEHTVLLVALLRALKIPARELGGLVYLNDDFGAFGWHAWAEVEIDGHWVQVDPSWDELVANATHINLGDEGHVNIGSMKLELL